MARYIITRHGSNTANQHMAQRAIVGTVEADSPEQAVEKMAGEVTVYVNQHLTARKYETSSSDKRFAADEADRYRAEEAAEIDAIYRDVSR